ncbi:MAG: hypothetical protein IJO33_05050 [Bacilli bacterium]|nr:hypothetical protein [Bacilli bacterium]
MESVEKLKKLVSSQRFIDKVGEFNASMFMDFIDREYLVYANSELMDIKIILSWLGFSEKEKTEINAYLYNKILKFYNGNSDHRAEYIKIHGNEEGKIYDSLCIKAKILRAYIDEEGNIVPCLIKPTEDIINLFQSFCVNNEENIIKIIKLSNKKDEEISKKVARRKQEAIELIRHLESLIDNNKFYNTKEIEDIKKLMRKQGYSPEEIQNVENQIEKNNKLYRMSHPKDNAPKPIKSVDYKQIKNLAHELKQFIGDDDKPYDYLSDDQINLVINLIQELGYSEERKNTILNNIKKYNEKIMCDENRFQLEKTREDVFKEIDSRKDKPFTALSSEIYEVALKNETKIEELNNRIKAALNEIQNSVRELVEFSEERTFYIEYIMEALNDIDQCFAQAIEWNLLRKRKS